MGDSGLDITNHPEITDTITRHIPIFFITKYITTYFLWKRNGYKKNILEYFKDAVKYKNYFYGLMLKPIGAVITGLIITIYGSSVVKTISNESFSTAAIAAGIIAMVVGSIPYTIYSTFKANKKYYIKLQQDFGTKRSLLKLFLSDFLITAVSAVISKVIVRAIDYNNNSTPDIPNAPEVPDSENSDSSLFGKRRRKSGKRKSRKTRRKTRKTRRKSRKTRKSRI
jgi:hypothetical protein